MLLRKILEVECSIVLLFLENCADGGGGPHGDDAPARHASALQQRRGREGLREVRHKDPGDERPAHRAVALANKKPQQKLSFFRLKEFMYFSTEEDRF